MKSRVDSYLYIIFFIFTLLISYYLGVGFFDITTGLDFNKYVVNLKFFSGTDVQVYDSQGTLYFWSIANFSEFSNELYTSMDYRTLINNKIQFINLMYYLLGLIGLGLLLKIKKVNSLHILLSLSVLNFFPTALYLG